MILIQKCDHLFVKSEAGAQTEPDFDYKMAHA